MKKPNEMTPEELREHLWQNAPRLTGKDGVIYLDRNNPLHREWMGEDMRIKQAIKKMVKNGKYDPEEDRSLQEFRRKLRNITWSAR